MKRHRRQEGESKIEFARAQAEAARTMPDVFPPHEWSVGTWMKKARKDDLWSDRQEWKLRKTEREMERKAREGR